MIYTTPGHTCYAWLGRPPARRVLAVGDAMLDDIEQGAGSPVLSAAPTYHFRRWADCGRRNGRSLAPKVPQSVDDAEKALRLEASSRCSHAVENLE